MRYNRRTTRKLHGSYAVQASWGPKLLVRQRGRDGPQFVCGVRRSTTMRKRKHYWSPDRLRTTTSCTSNPSWDTVFCSPRQASPVRLLNAQGQCRLTPSVDPRGPSSLERLRLSSSTGCQLPIDPVTNRQPFSSAVVPQLSVVFHLLSLR